MVWIHQTTVIISQEGGVLLREDLEALSLFYILPHIPLLFMDDIWLRIFSLFVSTACTHMWAPELKGWNYGRRSDNLKTTANETETETGVLLNHKLHPAFFRASQRPDQLLETSRSWYCKQYYLFIYIGFASGQSNIENLKGSYSKHPKWAHQLISVKLAQRPSPTRQPAKFKIESPTNHPTNQLNTASPSACSGAAPNQVYVQLSIPFTSIINHNGIQIIFSSNYTNIIPETRSLNAVAQSLFPANIISLLTNTNINPTRSLQPSRTTTYLEYPPIQWQM